MTDKQLEFKEKVLIVSLYRVIECYRFTDGRYMYCSDYDLQVWENSPYIKEDFYYCALIGNNFFIKSQEKVVRTMREAKQYQREQALKLIRKKEQEITKLRRKL